MQQQTQFNLSNYVTSSFALLPLTATTGIVSNIIGGVFKLPTAKFINIVGRAEGFASTFHPFPSVRFIMIQC